MNLARCGAANMEIPKFPKNISTINELIYFDENDYLREKTTNSLKLKQFISDTKYFSIHIPISIQ